MNVVRSPEHNKGTGRTAPTGCPGGRADPSHNLVSSVSLVGVAESQPGEISTRWTQFSDGSDLHPIIATYDSAGNPADRSFTCLVYYADHELL